MADTKSVSSASSADSDVFTFATDTIYAAVYCKSDNDGTPASGDEVEFRILHGGGDLDAAATADEYETSGHAPVGGVADTNTEDPAIPPPIPVDPTAKNMKLRATNGASTNAATVSGRVIEIGADGLKTSTLLAWT